MNNIQNNPAIKTAEQTNYLNDSYRYLKNVTITEYDIRSAGFSVLTYRKLLPADELEKLSKLDKHTRTVKEGLLQREHPKIAEEIVNTLSKVRQAFVLLNKIPDESILSIKKDAMFLINQTPQTLVIKDVFEWRKKGVYTSYLQLPGKKEFYYNGREDKLDVKGLSKEVVEKQNNFLLKDIKNFLRSGERVNQEMIFSLLKSYREKYLKRQLPLEVYRELDSGYFRVGDYQMESIDEDMKNEIDISQNYMNYILPLIQAML